jgi:hypothetical protein
MQVELEQRSIIKCLTKENMDAHEILAKFQAHLEDKGHALRTVRFWMGEIRRCREDLRDEHHSRRPLFDYIDTRILHILGKSPFGSARPIGQTLNTSPCAVPHHLHEVSGKRWVPQLLTDDLRFERKQVARGMILTLKLPPGMDGNIS